MGSPRTAVGMRAGLVALGVAVAVMAVAPGGATGQSVATTAANQKAAKTAPRPVAHRPTEKVAWTARVVIPVHARSAPRANARRVTLLTGSAPYNKNPEVLLVVGATSSVRGGVWYRVQLHSRPNDAAGWVPADAVQVRRTPFRVVVRLGERKAELRRSGKVIRTWPVAVGTRDAPTPVGNFALSEVVKQTRASGFFGPYILTLTAHSERFNDFDGGDGRVALHGTSQPSLLGTAASHGCVRFSNAAITTIGRMVPPGSPVDILE